MAFASPVSLGLVLREHETVCLRFYQQLKHCYQIYLHVISCAVAHSNYGQPCSPPSLVVHLERIYTDLFQQFVTVVYTPQLQ